MPLAESASEKHPPTALDETSAALKSLQAEAQLHRDQKAQTGLLGQAVTGLTEFWHGSDSTGTKVDDLSRAISDKLKAGDEKAAAELARQSKNVIEADRNALSTRAQIDQYGTGFVKSVGLFMPGKVGYIVTGATAALDAYKPAQNLSSTEATIDVALGITRAVGLKGAFTYAGNHNWGIATTAVGLGVASRVSETALNRSTYLNEGQYSASLGLQRTIGEATNVNALGTEIATMLIARGAVSKLNQASNGALSENQMVTKATIGAIFGATTGSVQEVVRQTRAGVFEPEKFATHVLASAASNMAGAAIGGRMEQMNAKASVYTSSEKTINVGNARANFDGSAAREYQLVGKQIPLAEMMATSKDAFALTRVREVKGNGSLGPVENMLVQHLGKTGGKIALREDLAAKADVIATCNPNCLPSGLKEKHVLGGTQENVWLAQNGSRLRFSRDLDLPVAGSVALSGLTLNKPALSGTVALGDNVRSVASILRDSNTRDMLRHKDTHDLGLYAEVLKDFKVPAKRVIDGGADSVVIELANNQILKVTNQIWNPAWGSRTYSDAQGIVHRFDAKIIGAPKITDGPYGPASYYIQERVQTPVTRESMDLFARRLDRDRKYSFWDRDESQLGYVDLGAGKKGLVLIDYDAVRPPNLVPKDMKKRWSQ
jgi:hypothetical protein